jgi:hypothetical protein
MTEAAVSPIEPPRRFRFNWIPDVLLRPCQAFRTIAAQSTSVWLTPMLVLTLTGLIRVLLAGSIRQAAAASGNITLPPDFQWYSPEQQAQIMQAMQAMQGPVFTYVFPAIGALLGVWIGWLVLGGLLHLVLTLLGGRGETGAAMNIVAWASLPYAVRDLVRIGAMLLNRQVIQTPGLAGFAPLSQSGPSDLNLYLTALLGLVDIYLIWQVILLVIGVRAANGLAPSKSTAGVLAAVLIVLCLQALIIFLGARFGATSVLRPFV